MKRLFLVIASFLALVSCGNPLGEGGTFIDKDHQPGLDQTPATNPVAGAEFNPLRNNYELSSGGNFKVSASVNATDKPAALTQSGRYKVFSTVQGQMFSGEGVR